MFKKVVVTAVIASAPKLISEARKIYESISDRRRTRKPVSDAGDQESSSVLRERIANLQETVDALEATEIDQADLVSQMAEQEQALATGLHGLSKRMGLQLWVTVIALVVAITAIVIGLA
jgi:hypothetical protein